MKVFSIHYFCLETSRPSNCTSRMKVVKFYINFLSNEFESSFQIFFWTLLLAKKKCEKRGMVWDKWCWCSIYRNTCIVLFILHKCLWKKKLKIFLNEQQWNYYFMKFVVICQNNPGQISLHATAQTQKKPLEFLFHALFIGHSVILFRILF